MMTFIRADVVGVGSEDFPGNRVWERSVWGLGVEIVPDWGSLSMVGLEAMGVEDWTEGR